MIAAADRGKVYQKVLELCENQFGVDKSEMNEDTRFVEDLNADSLDSVELAMEIEDVFYLSIPDEKMEELTTVRTVVDFVMAEGSLV